MNITQNTTLKELALSGPIATRVLESFRIDYCCGGQQTLFEACQSANLLLGEVLEALEQEELRGSPAADQPDWQNEPLTALTAHIVDQHHAYTKSELDRIDQLVDKVHLRHGTNHPELDEIKRIFQQLKIDLIPHMLKEEQVLFPYLAQMEEAIGRDANLPQPFFGTVQNPVRMMRVEHDTVGELLRELRRITTHYLLPADACASYQALYQGFEALETDLHQHIHLENNILFPRTVEMESSAAPERQHALKADCERSFCGH